MTVTAEQVGAWVAMLGVAAGGTIKLLTWLLGARAAERAQRKADLESYVQRQAADIERLRAQLEEADRRADDADRERAKLEGLLLRMGWERTGTGAWSHSGSMPPPGAA